MKRGMEPFLVLNRTISSKSVAIDYSDAIKHFVLYSFLCHICYSAARALAKCMLV